MEGIISNNIQHRIDPVFYLSKGGENRVVSFSATEAHVEYKNEEIAENLYNLAKQNKWNRFSIEGVSDQKELKEIIGKIRIIGWKYCKYRQNSNDFLIQNINPAIEDEKVQAYLWAKEMIVTPPNVATPEYLAEQIRQNFLDTAVEVKILEEAEINELGMNLLLAVAKGSKQKPKVIVLKKGSHPKLAIVGKGVTFDTGGISLKPAKSMDEMKADMAGGAVVAAVIKSIENSKADVLGVIGLVENMPSGEAYRPGDIYTSMGGINVEVTNTDAEGRMILGDLVYYASKTLGAEIVVDIATLTNTTVTLGEHYGVLCSNDDVLAKQILKAGRESNEKFWRLPCGDEFKKDIESPVADIVNSSRKSEAYNISGAKFIEVCLNNPGVRWAHLDIGGMLKKEMNPFGIFILTQFIYNNFLI